LARAEKMVLFIPLHQFDLSGNLVDSIAKFVEYNEFLVENPLQPKNPNLQLFIIFDGLDEFAMQGKAALESAQQFVREVQKTVERLEQLRLQVLITGRDVVIQANQSEFRDPEQILHVLSYAQNQRDIWWQQYGQARGKEYQGLPKELDRRQLQEVTAQPLLNYLVALSYERGEVNFSQDTNLNEVYADLLSAVHERGWEKKRQHQSVSNLNCEDFELILEEIAIATWHGDGRTTTVRAIETQCKQSGLKNLLDFYQEGAQQGLTKLLTAFYFRQADQRNQDHDKTFEFTHKSFAEYLTAKRVVNMVAQIHEELQRHKQSSRSGWNEDKALEEWAMLCGMTTMDRYVFEFVCNEMQLQKSHVSEWQKTLSSLISYMLREGMPMHKLPLPTYKETCRQARNAEEALLAALNACARVTQQLSDIEWESNTTFGEWVSRLQPQRSDNDKNTLAFNCFSYLNLKNSCLTQHDLHGANFEKTNFEKANLQLAILWESNCRGADFRKADLEWAIFWEANLMSANISDTEITGAFFGNASLQKANFQNSDIENANFQEANLKGANLERVKNIEKASFVDANLKDTVLEEWHKEKYK